MQESRQIRQPSSFRASLVSAGLFLAASAGAQGAELPTGQEVVERHVSAVGGRQAIDKVKSFHIQGTYNLPAAGAGGTVELTFARPEQLIFTVELPGFGKVQRGMIDGRGWSIQPGGSPAAMQEDEIKDVRKQALRGFSLLPGTAELRPARAVKLVDYDGRPCHAVTMTVVPTGAEYVDYYDVATGLLAGRVETVNSAQGPLEMTGTAADYKQFGDLKIATRWTHKAGGQEWTAIYTSFDINKVPASALMLPAEIASTATGHP